MFDPRLDEIEEKLTGAGQDLYFYLNHPIRWVRIAGIVVAVDEFPGKLIYTVDDSSSATIECVLAVPVQKAGDAKGGDHGRRDGNSTTTCAQPEKPKADGDIEVGDVLDVRGEITIFRDQKKLRVHKIVHLRCTDAEIRFWNKVSRFRAEVLSSPWTLTEKEIRRCRRDAERPRRGTSRRDKMERRRDIGSEVETGVSGTGSSRAMLNMTPAAKGRNASKVIRTGLERGATVSRSMDTGLENRKVAPVSDRGNSSKRLITGLERGGTAPKSTATGLEKRTMAPAADGGSASKARRTGLERKTKRVAPASLQGKYSALGI